MNNRDAPGKGFDPSSIDDVLELVSAWTKHRSMTAPQIADALRARGVVVRATASGRHIVVESRGRYANERREAKLFILPSTSHQVRQWLARARDPSPWVARVVRPPGRALHWVAGLFGRRTRERVLEPIIADMQLEYCEVLAAERPRTARLWWVQARAWIAFAEAIFLRTVVGRIIRGISRLV